LLPVVPLAKAYLIFTLSPLLICCSHLYLLLLAVVPNPIATSHRRRGQAPEHGRETVPLTLIPLHLDPRVSDRAKVREDSFAWQIDAGAKVCPPLRRRVVLPRRIRISGRWIAADINFSLYIE
jgi:hypothetical protein